MNIDWTQVKTAEQKEAEALEQALENARNNRVSAYESEADPLFFKYQAGEASKEEWIAKREEIRSRYPYPEES